MTTKWYIDLGEEEGFSRPYDSFDLAAEQVAWSLIRGFGADYQIEDAAGVMIGDEDGPHETVARFETLSVSENAQAMRYDAELVLTIDAPAHVPADLRAVARSAEPVVWVEYGPERSGARDMSTLYVQFNADDTEQRFAEMELNPIAALDVGMFVARADRPSEIYRVTSTLGRDSFRLLPYKRAGAEVVITKMRGAWSDGISQWAIVQGNPWSSEDVTREKIVDEMARTIWRIVAAGADPERRFSHAPPVAQHAAQDLADAVERLNHESLPEMQARFDDENIGSAIASDATSGRRRGGRRRSSRFDDSIVVPTMDVHGTPQHELTWTITHDGRELASGLQDLPDMGGDYLRHLHPNPAGLTAKGERMYKHVLASINLKADASKKAAKRTAAATVVGAANRGVPGLVRKNPARVSPGDMVMTKYYGGPLEVLRVCDGVGTDETIGADPVRTLVYVRGEYGGDLECPLSEVELVPNPTKRRNPSVRGICSCSEPHITAEHPQPCRACGGIWLEADGTDAHAAVELYKTFHRYDPADIGDFDKSFSIPRQMKRVGKAVHVCYRSGKVDPATLKKPTRPVNYIHEHDAGVELYVPVSDAEFTGPTVEVPREFASVTALAGLDVSLGYAVLTPDDETIEEEFGPKDGYELYAAPSGKCLYIVYEKREVVAMIWGGALGVFARGIDG